MIEDASETPADGLTEGKTDMWAGTPLFSQSQAPTTYPLEGCGL